MITEFLICSGIVLMSAFSAYWVVSKRRFDPAGGLVLGYAFFVGGPCFQLLIFGEISDYAIGLDRVSFGGSIGVLIYLFLGGLFAMLLIALPHHARERSFGQRYDTRFLTGSYLKLHLSTYLILALMLFFISGKHEGGHWMESNHAMYAQGFLPSIIGNFYNVLRVTLSGVVLFAAMNARISYKRALVLLAAFAVFELVVSSNRIIVLFALISAALILWKFRGRYLFVLALALPVLLQFNSLFPMVRGMMWNEGASLAQISDATRAALDRESEKRSSVADVLGSAFESSNVMVAQYVIDTYGRSSPLLYGETMFLKPITFFLPRAVFSYKPEGFNTRIGRALTGSDVLSLNSTLLGEAFGNFGWLGPVFFFLFSAIFVWLARFVGGELFQFQFFYVAFASWRFEYSFMLISVFVLVVIVVGFRGAQMLLSRKVARLHG